MYITLHEGHNVKRRLMAFATAVYCSKAASLSLRRAFSLLRELFSSWRSLRRPATVSSMKVPMTGAGAGGAERGAIPIRHDS